MCTSRDKATLSPEEHALGPGLRRPRQDLHPGREGMRYDISGWVNDPIPFSARSYGARALVGLLPALVHKRLARRGEDSKASSAS